MLRAVEILAKMHDRARKIPHEPPPPLDRPVVLFNETIAAHVGETTRTEIESALGVAFSYPVRGYHTYCIAGPSRERRFLSFFYSEDVLVAAEFYRPTTDRAPQLEPRLLGRFRFVPGEIELGMNVTAVPSSYVRTQTGPAHVVYDDVFEARFPGGVAYVMGRKGTVDRLALYADTRAENTSSSRA